VWQDGEKIINLPRKDIEDPVVLDFGEKEREVLSLSISSRFFAYDCAQMYQMVEADFQGKIKKVLEAGQLNLKKCMDCLTSCDTTLIVRQDQSRSPHDSPPSTTLQVSTLAFISNGNTYS
jgi:hypothetical protein